MFVCSTVCGNDKIYKMLLVSSDQCLPCTQLHLFSQYFPLSLSLPLFLYFSYYMHTFVIMISGWIVWRFEHCQ